MIGYYNVYYREYLSNPDCKAKRTSQQCPNYLFTTQADNCIKKKDKTFLLIINK